MMEESRTNKQDGLLVVVVAPSGRDAELICDTLRQASIECTACQNLLQVEQSVDSSTGVILLAEEAFTPAASESFAAVLRSQPAWSELPLIVLTVSGRSSEYSERMSSMRKPLGTALILERPVRRETLVAAVQSGLEARKRQYQLRNQIAALQQSQESLNAAIAASRTGTFRWDPDSGEFLEFGDNLRKLFGLAPGESVRATEDFLSRVHPEDRPAVAQASERVRRGADFEMEYRVVLPDGSSRWLYDRGQNIANANGIGSYLVGACTDVTDRKLAEEALRKTEKLAAAGRLAATIAHEINNPLEAVTNLLYLARNHPALDDTVRSYLARADQELDRVTHLTRQTLGFYRESNKPSQIDPCALMDNVLQLYAGKLKTKGIIVDRDYKALDNIQGIEGELRQVLSNLLANAIDASDRGSQITLTVAARRNGDGREWATWEISDTGPGIPQEHLTKIFEPFFTTKRDIGTGLGLWVSKDLIAKQGGTIDIRTSTDPGTSGTRVRVLVPLHHSASAPMPPVGSPEAA
jgi:PAS domain S-box-containing protein